MKITKRQLRGIIREKFARDDFRDVYATAQMAHVGQKRRSGEDYFSHPSEVRNIVRRFYPKDRVSELAALLHDSLEDAPGSTVDSPEEMEEFIRGSISDPASGDEVIRVVRALTHEKGGDYQSYVVDLMNDQPALRVKLADMVHNLSSSPSPKQKLKYKSALDAIGAQTGGQPPAGISQKHWDNLQTLTESKQMKITKSQLRRIIREQTETIEYNGEEWTRDDFLDAISDYSKELSGRRDLPVNVESMGVAELAEYYEGMFDSPEAAAMQAGLGDGGDSPRAGHPLEDSPKRQSMGRGMPEGKARFRKMESKEMNKDNLRRIIREEKIKLLKEAQDPSQLPALLDAINSGTASASMGMGLGKDEILISFGSGQGMVLKLRGF